MTPHIEAKKEDIAKIVIMPGDPLRAKMIAEKYLHDYKLVNTTRNMLAYTGYYNDLLVTVFSSGMGIPSIGIYAYELFKFYDVDKIIRIGTCGSFADDVDLLDIVIAKSAYSKSTFAYMFNGELANEMDASKELNQKIIDTAKKLNIKYHYGKIITSDVFDVYVDSDEYQKKYPHDKYLASEMEAFALFFLAKILSKEASTILTVVDNKKSSKSISSEDRQNSLNQMVELALKSL